MIILHAGFLDNRLLLWGESPPEATTRPAPRHGRKARGVSLHVSPFDAGAPRLISALEYAGVLVSRKKARTETAVVWLPTSGDVPVPSSPLVAETPDGSRPVHPFPLDRHGIAAVS